MWGLLRCCVWRERYYCGVVGIFVLGERGIVWDFWGVLGDFCVIFGDVVVVFWECF